MRMDRVTILAATRRAPRARSRRGRAGFRRGVGSRRHRAAHRPVRRRRCARVTPCVPPARARWPWQRRHRTPRSAPRSRGSARRGTDRRGTAARAANGPDVDLEPFDIARGERSQQVLLAKELHERREPPMPARASPVDEARRVAQVTRLDETCAAARAGERLLLGSHGLRGDAHGLEQRELRGQGCRRLGRTHGHPLHRQPRFRDTLRTVAARTGLSGASRRP